jgi:hypothetical protein
VKNMILSAAALVALTACGDPLRDVEKLSDVELSETDAMRGVIATPEEVAEEGGFLAGLFKRPQPKAEAPTADAGDADVAPTQSPLFTRLMRREADRPLDRAEPQTAALDAPVETQSDAPVAKPRAGLFSRARSAPEAGLRDVAAGTRLPFGEVARACDAKKSDMGKRIEKAGAGRGYAIYDSQPGATGPRSFYVTGFDDGCARKFTAALAMFGAPSMHEQLRYGRPSDLYPYSDTDRAYEKVKSSVCGVGRRKPCGSNIRQLERDTVFVSVYERFSDNGRWADILLHDGAVLASAIKDF